MLFWVGILVGVIFAYLAIRRGLYETWAILFNIILSIYLAIVLNPLAKHILPRSGHNPYDNTLVMLALGVGFFILLHGIVYVLVLSQFKIDMGRILDLIGSGVIGLAGGILIWSFVLILLCSSPLVTNKFLRATGVKRDNVQANVSYVCRFTGLIEKLVGTEQSENVVPELLDSLLEKYDKTSEKKNPLEEEVQSEEDEQKLPDINEPNST
ncbi:MAG: hypothetical protein PVG93_01155 [Phycisphaerales bacterium]|jgi:uncharacterized membrane protein required for colicin V production